MSITDDLVISLLSQIKADVGEVKGTLTATVDAHNTRFENIEKTMDSNDRRQWVVSAAVIPIVSALHYLANKIGIKV